LTRNTKFDIALIWIIISNNNRDKQKWQ